MSTSLPNKPSSPLETRRKLPQHPKMRLSYILNPYPPTQPAVIQPVEPEPVPLREQPVSGCPSSQYLSDFGDMVTSPLIPDLSSDFIGSSLLPNATAPSPDSSGHELPVLLPSRDLLSTSSSIPDLSTNLSPYSLIHPHPYHRSGSSPSENSRSLFQAPISLLPCLEPDSSSESTQYSVLYNSINGPENYHDSRSALGTNSFMNPDSTELQISHDRSSIYPPLFRPSPLQPHDPNTVPHDSLPHPEPHPTPSSLTTMCHPKMELLYILNPSTTVNEHEVTTPEFVEQNSVPSPTSRSPSPTVSDSELSSSSTSFFHRNRSPDHTRQPRLNSPPHDESTAPSPATTPPSSPPPVPHVIPDLPQMVQPPQLLPWEGPPPQGLNARNHQAYQRAGVHWMLAEIFGPDIG
ncbi:hypothetical protein Clacol_000894 [Clathrus columnatus]|uniref:Uncharacterized protein n=1 Tax=Clathrus columnatus TaxID=1419009 RepID=A0AAV5A1T7_9AGAM|nr:hypothetical protein Clacol_000894 [Clathrus columnatus]